MNPAVAALLGSISTGAVTLLIAVMAVAVGRGGRRADIADKITEASDRIFERMGKDYEVLDRKCGKCETELGEIKRVLRAWVRAVDSNDPATISAAIAAARDLT